MHLMTSPPSEPPTGHHHCTPHLPHPSPAQLLACPAITLLSLLALSPLSFPARACLSAPLGQEPARGVPAIPLFVGRQGVGA